jgi:archaemetzincin
MYLYLWWIGEAASDHHMMEKARTELEHVFGIPAQVWSGRERPADIFDPARRQHSSTRVLQWLVGMRPADADKILAITDVDLFIPILTFVFGEAQLDGLAAVVSTARLVRNPDGTPADRRLLTARLVKECVHELGHTFGLVHCADRHCVMARSAALLDVDAKRGELCRECRTRFKGLRQRRGDESHE